MAPKLDPSRFLRVQFRAELGKPCAERFQTSSCVGFLSETDHDVGSRIYRALNCRSQRKYRSKPAEQS